MITDPGIIPACAGSTRRARERARNRRDYPRMRGEHLFFIEPVTFAPGSSPHARGALKAVAHSRVRHGIIPACAGSTIMSWTITAPTRDHPRMRGEHSRDTTTAQMVSGSSPHARGAQTMPTAERPSHGIIPACAGSTWPRSCSGRWGWDHPRMRGEHTRPVRSRRSRAGSSPHARGARTRARAAGAAMRIIPACAGSTYRYGARRRKPQDHPRMRGEHMYECDRCGKKEGSSPHARGAPREDARERKSNGIIPACAGSTAWTPSSSIAWRDHPRMRGEHSASVP